VNERRDGTRRLYSVRSEGLTDLHGFLAEVLPGRLQRLKEVVEREDEGGRGARRN
jgi:hypothetical protein